MSRTLVIDPGPFTWRLGVVDEGGLARLRVVDLVAGVEHGLFAARVTAQAKDLGGVFADIGGETPVFVRMPAARRRRPPGAGDALVVQGVADAVADKGARATTTIALAGAHLTRRGEGGPAVAVDARGEVAERLTARARGLFVDAPVTLAASADAVADAVLLAEAAALDQLAAAARERFAAGPPPGPLLTPDERLALALRGLAAGVDAVVTTGAMRLRVARLAAAAGLTPEVAAAADPWTEVGAAGALEEAAATALTFADGAALVIEPTAACVAVDVDRRGSRAPALALDTAAVAALARAIAVRELAGQLVVDFLEPGGGKERDRLEAELGARLAPLDVRLVTLLRAGLAVMERPRRAAALHERIRPSRDAAERLLREAAGHAKLEARVAADVDDALARYASAAAAWLDRHGASLVRRRDPDLPPATYRTATRTA